MNGDATRTIADRAVIYGTVGALGLIAVLGWGLAPGARAATGGEGGQLTTDSHLHRVYLAQPRSNRVFVLSLDGSTLLDVLRVPAHPTGLAVDAIHSLLYVASDPAGIISRYDTLTDRLIGRYHVTGHPSGVAVTDNGRTIMVVDATHGTLRALMLGDPTRRTPLHGGPQTVEDRFVVGPDVEPAVLLAPQRIWSKGRTLVWARGFKPGEPVEVSWGVYTVVRLHADATGEVSGRFTVPSHVALGDHLLIVQGLTSLRTESTLVTVVHAPPPPRHRRKVHSTAATGNPLQRLLALNVRLTLPSSLWAIVHPRSVATVVPSNMPQGHAGSIGVLATPTARGWTLPFGLHVTPPLALHLTVQRTVSIPLVLFAVPFAIVGAYLVRLVLRVRHRRAARRAPAGDGVPVEARGRRRKKKGNVAPTPAPTTRVATGR